MVVQGGPYHLHLDPVGGVSGDMFIGAILDARPDLAEGLERVLEQAGFPDLVKLDCSPHNDGTLTGSRFCVSPLQPQADHHHRHYREIREIITESNLADEVKTITLDIFHRIAVVEADIHGKQVAEVAFHEVGAWDSIADIVLAAHLITCVNAASWSLAPLPLGSGQVATAHGMLPVPAPATSRLLLGLPVFDDGVAGERVTPTGAAILSHLAPASRLPPGKLVTLGYGFGSKQFPGLSNVLRLSVFEIEKDVTQLWQDEQVARLGFDIDDQTAEELGSVLEQLRTEPGVLDVQTAMIGSKKNRQGISVTILATTEVEARVLAFCFDHTSTLGIRRERINRAVLPRQEYQLEHEGRQYRVKVASRPGGLTAKVDMDDLQQSQLTLAQQSKLRAVLESQALALAEQDTSGSG